MNDLLASALDYASRDWPVFPLHGIVDGRCACGRSDCTAPGKHPLTRNGFRDATTDFPTIRSWWASESQANIGLVTGEASDLVVVDLDLPRALESLDAIVHKLPNTLTALTGGGGVHLIYRRVHALRCTSARVPGISGQLPGVDMRADGGYIVAPPSVHRSGGSYQWLDANRPVMAAPAWLKQPERVYVAPENVAATDFTGDGTPYALAVLRDELDRVRAAQVGTRNHQLNRSAFALARLVAGGELLEAAARSALLGVALAIGLEERESRQTLDSAFNAGLRQPRTAPHRRM